MPPPFNFLLLSQMHSLLFYLSSAGITIAPIAPVGTKTFQSQQIEMNGGGFSATVEEAWFEGTIESPFQIPGIREVYCKVVITDIELQEFNSKRIGNGLKEKIMEGIAISKQLNRQWHPRPISDTELQELIEKNISDFKKGREKYKISE